MNIDPSSLDTGNIPEGATEVHASVTAFITSLIPTSLVGAFTDTNLLAALVVSLLFGVALNMAGEAGAPLVAGVNALSNVAFRIVGWVMRLGPSARSVLSRPSWRPTGSAASSSSATSSCCSPAPAFVYVVVLGAIIRACGRSLFGLMRFLKAELLVALSTCSSEAALPQLIKRLEDLRVGKSVVGIVIPSGFSFNLDGSAVYLTMAFLFLAQATGTDLYWEQQLVRSAS